LDEIVNWFTPGRRIGGRCGRLPTFMMVAGGHGGVFEGGSQCWDYSMISQTRAFLG
jgi:hypothetical protein